MDKLRENPDHVHWLTYFVWHREAGKIIGSGGYKGMPDSNGCVEIGYEIFPEYQNRGFATEFAEGLVANAFTNPKVNTIVAHTLSEENASTRILKKIGFNKLGEIHDPDDGLIWRWELGKGLRRKAESLHPDKIA
ncbi:MAG: GNAT family N-acetyltransferase [Saprospiraceae bacterium]|nr:GNAT family N-acetyltransferase [Saprospiraceae bacterium]